MRSEIQAVALVALACGSFGCGPSASTLREQTLSTLNQAADAWDGGPDFKTDATDAYGRALSWGVEKGPINRVLELRSDGPDGLPKNSDDVFVRRSRPHGESTVNKEIERAAESIGRGAGSGLTEGIKKGLGLGKPREAKE